MGHKRKDRKGEPEYSVLLAQQRLILEATELIVELLEKREVTRADLARKLGTSSGNITQLLDGRNMTLGTLAEVAHVLGAKVELVWEEVS